jgi:hypothetical protein
VRADTVPPPATFSMIFLSAAASAAPPVSAAPPASADIRTPDPGIGCPSPDIGIHMSRYPSPYILMSDQISDLIFVNRYRVFPDIGSYPISGKTVTRYRKIPNHGIRVGYDPISARGPSPIMMKNVPISGPISGYTDIGTYVPISGHVKNPDA